MKKLFLSLVLASSLLSGAIAQDYKTIKHRDARGYEWEEVTNDPTHTRVYTLRNGLKVYLSRNESQPRIQTYIPVRTGSNNDPADYTGLAHYLEHMLFKGTSKLGSLDWEKERVELKKISDLYEQHKAASDSLERVRLYRQIDSISQIAAQYVAPNEYDRLTTSLGAQGTNAHTWVEETVYKNDIPANELERWLQIESERFGELVLRLFHTEMEAVYEEFNMGQDRAMSRVLETLNANLFPTHPLGQQTTIGTSEHLKSPSLEAIHRYFDRYYTPSNYAIVLVGDIDFDKTIHLVDKYFGNKESHPVQAPQFAQEAPLDKISEHSVYSLENEQLLLGYRRAGGRGSDDEVYTTLVDMILSNGKAGLIDLDLNQAQRVNASGSFTQHFTDYTTHLFYALPKHGQKLEEAKDLLIGQINRVAQGDFPDWLLEAVVNDYELQMVRGYTNADAVATQLYELYIHGQSIENRLKFISRMRAVTKADLMAYVRKHYKDNYVVVYQRQGENKSLVRVANPGITPLEIDRNALSTFGKEILAQEAPRLSPLWVDYKASIKQDRLGKQFIEYITNEDNELFELSFIFNLGSRHDRKLALAIDYLDYLGTDKLSAAQIQQEFYKLGISYGVSAETDRTTISISGLGRNLPAGLKLVETLLANVQPNQEAWETLKESIYKSRKDAKMSKDKIFRELTSIAMYGEDTPTRASLSREELEATTAEELTNLLRQLMQYQHRVFYYGNDLKTLKASLKKHHRFGSKVAPAERTFKQIPTGGQVLYADYDMVQTQLMMLRRVEQFDAKEMALSSLFNSYFGGGMGSIVFQEIREAKSLAYSAYAYYGGASKLGDYNYVRAFVGTQANKLPEALAAMEALITDMPLSQQSFEAARESALRDIESERIIRQNVFWGYERLKRLGITEDYRRDVYEALKTLTLDDLKAYFDRVIKGDNYTYVLIGREGDLPLDLMSKYGTVKKLDTDYIFGNKE